VSEERRVRLDRQALRELPDSLAMLEFLALQDQPALLDLREAPDSPELRGLREQLALREGLEQLDLLDLLDLKANKA